MGGGSMSFQFDEQFKMSEDEQVQSAIFTFIRENIPGVSFIDRAGAHDDRRGTDYWVHLDSGKRISLDVKIRATDFAAKDPPQDDLALEVWSVVGKKVGWTRDPDKQTDYVLWHWKDSGRICMLAFPLLCAVFNRNMDRWIVEYDEMIQTQTTVSVDDSSYQSSCIFIPRHIVIQAMIDQFGGRVAA